MIAHSATAYAAIALVLIVGIVVVFALRIRVKARSASRACPNVRVYDFAANLKLPPAVNDRSYHIALYLTMKSLPREPAETPRVSTPAAWR